MYVVTVTFVVDLKKINEFMLAMNKQAKDSLTLESGCTYFDVCVSETKSNTVFLYEIYNTKADFDEHLASAHFVSFNSTITPWVIDKRVACFLRQ